MKDQTETVPSDIVPHLDIIKQYFSYISDKHYLTEIFTFALLDETGGSVIKGHGTRFAKVDELEKWFQNLRGIKFTLHHTLNRTSHRGRKGKDVQAVRVICVDLDAEVDRSKIKQWVVSQNVGMVVESSPNKYHLYWRIGGRCSLEMWQKAQLAYSELFSRYGADRTLAQLQKTIRVPGVPRITKSGEWFLPSIVYLNQEAEVDLSQELWINQKYEEAKSSIAAERKELRESLRGLQSGENRGAKFTGTLKRNTQLFLAVKYYIADLKIMKIGMEEASAYAELVNSAFPEDLGGPLDEVEFTNCVASAHAKGMLARARREQKVKRMSTRLLVDLPGINGTNGHHPIRMSELSNYLPFIYQYDEPLLQINRFTEPGVAARVIQRFSPRLLRVGRQVYAFDDVECVWKVQSKGDAPEISAMAGICALDTINDPEFIRTLCMTDDGEPSLNKQRKAQERFLNLRLQGLVCNAVQSSKSMKSMNANEFDKNPTLFFGSKGVTDISSKNMKIRIATPTDYLLARSDVIFQAEAECPRWLEFLGQVFARTKGGARGMIPFMQEVFGYSISGYISEQKIFCHYGDGANGKSKVLFALATIMGGYCTYLEPDELGKVKGIGKSFERFGAKIEGRRTCIIDDVDVKSVWNESIVKNLTSERLRARGEYEKSREIMNRTKLHLGLNVAPSPEAENYGVLRRLCFIPYEVRFEPSGKKEKEITEMIKAEASGILNWAIEGFQRYYERGSLEYPEATQLAIDDYKSEYFPVENILEEMFEPVVGLPVGTEESSYWFWMAEIAQEVSAFVQQREGDNKAAIPQNQLTRALKRYLGYECLKKIWNKERGNYFSAVKLKKKYNPETLFERGGIL